MFFQTLRSSFTSRLSKQMGLWVFTGILGVEALIFLPSAERRKEEQLDRIAMTAKATVNTLAITAPNTATFVDRLPAVQQDSPVLGATLYKRDGKITNQVGQQTSFDFAQAQATQGKLHYRSPWIYEIAIPVKLNDCNGYAVLLYDASLVQQDLFSFAFRILGLVLVISVTVTLLMMWIVNTQLIYPILLLQSDMGRSGRAIAQGEAITEFKSQRYQVKNELLQAMQSFYQTHAQIVAAMAERDQSELTLKHTAEQLQLTLSTLQQTQAQLVHTEKMSSLGQLGAGFAHEINNPINFIDGNLEHINQYGQDLLTLVRHYQQEVSSPSVTLQKQIKELDLEFIKQDMPSLVSSMRVGSQRIRDLVMHFRNFVRLDESEQKKVDLHEGLESTVILLQSRLKATTHRPEIQVERQYAQSAEVLCHPKQLNQVFMNLITNAIEAIDQKMAQGMAQGKAQGMAQLTPIASPTIKLVTQADETHVIVQIADNGIGIAPSIATKVFDPFFTTKDVGQGMGLGLTNSYHIIQQLHEGSLDFAPGAEQGTIFTIRLPKSEPLAHSLADPDHSPSPTHIDSPNHRTGESAGIC
jgi:signal transduction histidine kinase